MKEFPKEFGRALGVVGLVLVIAVGICLCILALDDYRTDTSSLLGIGLICLATCSFAPGVGSFVAARRARIAPAAVGAAAGALGGLVLAVQLALIWRASQPWVDRDDALPGIVRGALVFFVVTLCLSIVGGLIGRVSRAQRSSNMAPPGVPGAKDRC